MSGERKPVTLPRLTEMKEAGEPIVMVTAYDFPSASVAEQAGVDIVLVGDTAAVTVLGYEGTEPVSMDELVMLGKAVRRGLKTPLMIGDLSRGVVVGGDHHDRFAGRLHLRQAGQGHRLTVGQRWRRVGAAAGAHERSTSGWLSTPTTELSSPTWTTTGE